MAHSYSHLFNIPCTGLRFFTVYGPWGRPDMAPMLFTKAIIEGQSIKVFNNGDMARDFTYIDDVVEVIIRLLDKPAHAASSFNRSNPNPSSSSSPHITYNVGNNKTIKLMDFITTLEKELNIEAKKVFEEMQPGDVKITSADTNSIELFTGFKPKTTIQYGVNKFINWYKDFYK